jgi:hypothetical protein
MLLNPSRTNLQKLPKSFIITLSNAPITLAFDELSSNRFAFTHKLYCIDA